MTAQCVACGCDLTGIFSKHFFGAWDECAHCLPCGKACEEAGHREQHTHEEVSA